jgi:hypothetical protein
MGSTYPVRAWQRLPWNPPRSAQRAALATVALTIWREDKRARSDPLGKAVSCVDVNVGANEPRHEVSEGHRLANSSSIRSDDRARAINSFIPDITSRRETIHVPRIRESSLTQDD